MISRSQRMRLIRLLIACFAITSCSSSSKPVSWSQYQQIQPGMTYDQVVQLVGQKGDVESSDRDGNVIILTYQFSSSTGNFLVQFHGHKVIAKSPGSLRAQEN
jgi:hypothetical protein